LLNAEIRRSPLLLSALAQSHEYIPLIRPFILPFLPLPSPKGQWVAIEARVNGELVALTLSEVYDQRWKRNAQLYSFIVKPSARQQGIGGQIFAFTQELLVKEEKIESLEFYYIQEDPSTPALEKILISKGWTPAKIFFMLCHFFDVCAFNPSWLHYPCRLPSSLLFFPWNELLPADREYIAYLVHQGRCLPYLNPLQEKIIIHTETSMGLRRKSEILGWNITERLDPSTLSYSMLYIDSALLGSGVGIQLLAQSIRRQKALAIPKAFLEINVREIDPSWKRFLTKRLFPLADKIDRVKHAFRFFGSTCHQG